MKKSIIILILIVSFSSCKKVDFRDQYVGEYCCDYGGCVTIEKIENNNSFNIKFIEFNGYGQTRLREDGSFYSSNAISTIDGYFKGDSLFYKFAYKFGPLPLTYNKCVKK